MGSTLQRVNLLRCPRCNSEKVWRDGKRVLADNSVVQRFVCRSCGFRFSEQNKNRCVRSERSDLKMRRIERVQCFAGISPRVREKLIAFLWWMKKQGYSEHTILSRGKKLRRLAKLGANLLDPESVKEAIAKQEGWSESYKEAVVCAYDLFVKWMGLEWDKPRYKRVKRLPFVPLEREVDDLIAGCSEYISAFLQIAKETGARAGEIFQLRWDDIDFERNVIRIAPEKGSEPRVFRMSSRLIGMLSKLPRNNEKVFSHYKNLNSLSRVFQRQRRRIAYKLANPRLLKISFHTLRHWKATMEYAKTRDILHVMKTLGHKSIKNTLIYTQLVKGMKDDEFICKVARTVDEARQLIEAGFEYVCDINGVKLFRKRK